MRVVFAVCTLVICVLLQSCITRTEQDVYTITERDTTRREIVTNAPGDRDNGVIYPSSRTIEIQRTTVTRDSVVERGYPNFIRFGVFESAGFVATGAGKNGIGTGLFGVYGLLDPDFGLDVSSTSKTRDVVFTGGLYRLGIGEWRLRWFRDAENWTIGTSLVEVLAPEANGDKILISSFPVYVRKRYFLREEIPYVAVTPTFGIGWAPSQYINLGATFDVGSIGGLNMRAYAGFAAGMNGAITGDSITVSAFPYFGLGISMMDFLNIVPETYREWKYHEHSAWNIGLLEAAFLYTSAERSIIQTKDTTVNVPLKGVIGRLLPASVALPFLDHKLYAGTSLLNIVYLGDGQGGFGLLPLRIGYWHTLLPDELSVEPFVEYNYFPSSFVHLGARLNLYVKQSLNVSLTAGFASGNTTNAIASDFTDQFGNPTSFSGAYIGIGLGLSNRIFFPEELRYNKQP